MLITWLRLLLKNPLNLSTGTMMNIETKEQLLHTLYEAAEIEHCLMCTYLYAAFSLDKDTKTYSTDESKAVSTWHDLIMSVAIEEMVHLTLVNNLIVSMGATAHFSRPNFPVNPGYFPAGVVAKLVPFSKEAIEHFIFLERPDLVNDLDGAGFAHTNYQRPEISHRVMPHSQDYETIGGLYRAIRDGLIKLSTLQGETVLFCGKTTEQLGPLDINLPGIQLISNLNSALSALDEIIVQGEGASEHLENSHYSKFIVIRDELSRLQNNNPQFKPALPVAANPVMRKPVDGDDKVWINHKDSVLVLDLTNAIYTLMLRLMLQSYNRHEGSQKQKSILLNHAITLMHFLTPLAKLLAILPANSDYLGVTAGITFATLRDTAPLSRGNAEWQFLKVRTSELATRAQELMATDDIFLKINNALNKLSTLCAEQIIDHDVDLIVTDYSEINIIQSEQSINSQEGDMEIAEGKDVIIYFEAKRCIHSRNCVQSQPDVFKANTPGAWIFPDNASAEEVAHLAQNCPSGAIRYKRKDTNNNEHLPLVNTIHIRENGPLAVHAEIVLDDKAIGTRATLCRCGASNNKPFCDGSHKAIAFIATGEPNSLEAPTLANRAGILEIQPQENGPNKVVGNIEICCGTGRAVARTENVLLCRCGGSSNKPFCDGTHKKIGFIASANV
jgi:CDGSH-type Zn-finger protein/uncharacterized Fe-S cluster protein YjdI